MARTYVQAHRLEDVLSEAVNELLTTQPDDPVGALGELLLARSVTGHQLRASLKRAQATVELQQAELDRLRSSHKENSHEDETTKLPPSLREFTPLAKSAPVAEALVGLRALEKSVTSDPSCAEASRKLTAALEQASAVIARAIAARLDEHDIVATCDAVIADGSDHFLGVYESTFHTIESSEGVAAYEAPVRELQTLISGASACRQRTGRITDLFVDAASASLAFGTLVQSVAQELPHCGLSYSAGQLKSTARILEKSLLRPDEPGNADRVCDVVRAM